MGFTLNFYDAIVILASLVFVGAVFGMICWTVIRLVRGHPRGDKWDATHAALDVPPMFEKLLDKAMAERDRREAALLERVQVLERIVIDTHRSHDLAGEIDRLRDRG